MLLLLPLSRVLCGCDIDVITDFPWVTQKANRHTKHNGNVDANRVYTENLATSVHCRYSFLEKRNERWLQRTRNGVEVKVSVHGDFVDGCKEELPFPNGPSIHPNGKQNGHVFNLKVENVIRSNIVE